jgi:cytochrome c heme-lyase
VRMRYIIDFYTGRMDPSAPHNPSFYIDARPALDNWEGVRMRAEHVWEQWVGRFWGPSVKMPSSKSKDVDKPSSAGVA